MKLRRHSLPLLAALDLPITQYHKKISSSDEGGRRHKRQKTSASKIIQQLFHGHFRQHLACKPWLLCHSRTVSYGESTAPTPVIASVIQTQNENEGRAYLAKSRRPELSIKTDIKSARRVSNIHKTRTGRALKVREEIVLSNELYEEEYGLLRQSAALPLPNCIGPPRRIQAHEVIRLPTAELKKAVDDSKKNDGLRETIKQQQFLQNNAAQLELFETTLKLKKENEELKEENNRTRRRLSPGLSYTPASAKIRRHMMIYCIGAGLNWAF